MASLAEIYGKGLHSDFKYYYTHWLPNSPIQVGTVGELVNGVLFRPLSTLSDRGIEFDPEKDVLYDTSPSPMMFRSSSGFSMTTKVAGEVNEAIKGIPTAKAGLKLSFGKEGAFTIEAKESYEHRIRDVTAIERQVRRRYQQGSWPSHHVIVFALVEAPYADLIISESRTSEIELEAEATGAAGTVELGNAEVAFTVRHTAGRVLDMRGSRDVGPICQLLGLKRRWPWGPGQVGPLMKGMGDLEAASMEGLLPPPGEDFREEDYHLALLGGE